MRWGLIGGAVVAAGAAAYVGTQLTQGGLAPANGSGTSASASSNAPAAGGRPAPTREAITAGLREALGAVDAAMVSATLGALSVATLQPGLNPGAEQTRTTKNELPSEDGKPAGTRTTTVATRVDGSGSRRTVFSEFKISERRGDSGLNLRGKLTATVDVCPDAEGVVPFEIDLQASGDTNFSNVVGTGGFSMNLSARGGGKGNVNDSAVVTDFRKQIDGDYTIRGGENLSGKAVGHDQTLQMRTATDGRFAVGSTATVTSEASGPGPLVVGIGDKRIDSGGAVGGSASEKATIGVAAMMDSIVDDAVRSLLQSAQNAWRGGECVEVVVAPPLRGNGESNPTQPKERKDIEARVRHKFEGRELPLPIDATLAGNDKLADPKHVERAPGRFAYTAGAGERDWGRVDLKTVSRRGIGQNSVDFSNQGDWAGTFKVTSTGGPMQMMMTGEVRWRRKDGSDTEFVVDGGTYTLVATRRDCTGSASGKLGPGDGELEVKLSVSGDVQAYRGIGMKPISFSVSCPNSQLSRTMPAPWFATGEDFKPVATDGSMLGSLRDPEGSWLWEWSFKR